jgi:hypothetical protein
MESCTKKDGLVKEYKELEAVKRFVGYLVLLAYFPSDEIKKSIL